MSAKILYGAPVSEKIEEQVSYYTSIVNTVFKLVVISIGEDPASQVYIKNKKDAAERCGLMFQHYQLSEETTERELIEFIEKTKQEEFTLRGLIVQLPLPKHINERVILELIDPFIDVDGFHPESMGKLVQGLPCHESCTPAGIMEILDYYNIPIEGKTCVVIGRSNMVGKPMAQMLTNANGTVILCHSKTTNLKELTQLADIVVVAIGKANFITSDYIKEGAIVIDVGIHRVNGKLTGDTLQDEAMLNKTSAITPVPGGVGKTTVAMLMGNVIKHI